MRMTARAHHEKGPSTEALTDRMDQRHRNKAYDDRGNGNPHHHPRPFHAAALALGLVGIGTPAIIKLGREAPNTDGTPFIGTDLIRTSVTDWNYWRGGTLGRGGGARPPCAAQPETAPASIPPLRPF